MEEFIKKLNEYLLQDDNIDACLLMGSITDLNSGRYDEYSDVDLFLITEKKDDYLNNCKWLEFYRRVSLYFKDPISLGIGTELRVCFDNELLSDIAIVNYDEFLKLMNNQIFETKIIGRGYKVLKSKYPEEMYQVKEINNDYKLDSYSLNRLRDEFLIDIYNVLKYYFRKDYFTSFYAFERRISKIIIYVLEESYKLDKTKDVMFNGRYMEKWLNEEDYRKIETIFLNINKETFLKSVDEAIDLFEKKCDIISKKLEFQIENKEESIKKIKRRIEDGK